MQYPVFACQLPRSPAVSLHHFRDLKVSCFSVDFFEWCVECHIVLYHQPPLLNPDPSFVGLSRCMFSNVVFFRVHPRPKLSVEVSRDDSDVFFVVAVRLDVFLHLLDVHVRVSRMGEEDTGQFDFVVIALISRGDHPFTGVLCLNPSLPTLVQEKTKSMFLSSSTCTHRYSSISLLLYHGKRCLRMISFLPFFLLLLCLLLSVLPRWWELSSLWCALLVRLCCQMLIVAVCTRQCIASSSSCVSCSTNRSHLILVFHAVRACSVPLLQNAHWHITVWVEKIPRPPPAVSPV